MESNTILLIACLILVAKIVMAVCEKWRIPPVIGLIMLGVFAGKTGLNLVYTHDDLYQVEIFAEIGVILLLFLAGLETDLGQLRKMGRNSFLIAVGGIVLPFLMGYYFCYQFTHHHMRSIIMGTVLVATSVSIPVMTLMNLKRLNTVEGRTIISAAVIDDVIGILFLSAVLGFAGVSDQSVSVTLLKVLGFIIGSIVAGIYVLPLLLRWASRNRIENMVISVSMAIMLIYAWLAHHSELAAITGAFLCGLFIGRTRNRKVVMDTMRLFGDVLFVPFFFIYIGMETDLRSGEFDYLFILVFSVVAIVSKLLGSGGTARLIGFEWDRSLVIGAGMIPRGEVGLIVAALAASEQKGSILNEMDYSATVFVVILTTIISPLLIRAGYSKRLETGKTEGKDNA